MPYTVRLDHGQEPVYYSREFFFWFVTIETVPAPTEGQIWPRNATDRVDGSG